MHIIVFTRQVDGKFRLEFKNKLINKSKRSLKVDVSYEKISVFFYPRLLNGNQ